MNCRSVAGPGQPVSICATAPLTTAIDPKEQAAYKAFYDEDIVEAKILLGEAFDEKYPKSVYEDSVDSALTSLYYNKQDWPKFYAVGAKVIAKNPKNFPILELVGWAIPRNSPIDPIAANKLNEAVDYEKRAVALIAAMKRPKEIDEQDFDISIEGLSWRAYSGLGLAYFRLKDYADSAAALQTAVKDEAPEPDAGDLWALGIDLENLNRKTEAIDAFSKCFQISGDLQDRCQQDLQKAKNELAESSEDAAYEAFTAANTDAQIQLGEKFDQTYPASEYEERVDTALASLYQSEKEWTKFYAMADKVLAKDANNVPILASVAWAISHNYNERESDASAKLDEAEKDGRRALDLVAAMRKPADLTDEQFDQAKENASKQAYSGLGIAYFRRGDFERSARELQAATTDNPQPDAFDLYVLGIDQEKLGHTIQAASTFSRCAEIAGSIEAQCKGDADALEMKSAPTVASLAAQSDATAELAAKPSSSSSTSVDIPQSTQGPRIKAETVLVPVRVVVRDTKGGAVADLKKEDFKLYQDGKLVDISTFTAVNIAFLSKAASTTASGPAGTSNRNSGGTPAMASTPTQFVALFFDDVHLYFSDMAQTRNAATKYIASLLPQDRVAIVTASGLGGLDFTDDRKKLQEAMAKLQPVRLPGGPTMAEPEFCPPPMTYTEADAIINHDSAPVLAIAGADFSGCYKIGPGLASASAGLEAGSALARAAAARAEIARQEALDDIFDRLEKTVRRLSGLPGQRIVVLISPGFVDRGRQAQFSEVTNLAIRYNVVINTLDAKAIYEVGFTDINHPGAVMGGAGKWDPDRFKQFGYGHFEVEQPILEDLADATGGLFVKNNNDFQGVIRELSEPPEIYYLLSYSPQNLPADGKYHVLKVSLAKHSLDTVQARRGFYAPSAAETPDQAAKREIEDALFSEGQQHDLPVKLETQIIRDASGAQKLDVKTDVDLSQLHFEKNAGTNAEELTVAAALFDNDGNYVTGTQKVDQMNLSDATLEQLNKSGFFLEMDFDLKPGDYTLRLVARDSNDGHIAAQTSAVSVPN